MRTYLIGFFIKSSEKLQQILYRKRHKGVPNGDQIDSLEGILLDRRTVLVSEQELGLHAFQKTLT